MASAAKVEIYRTGAKGTSLIGPVESANLAFGATPYQISFQTGHIGTSPQVGGFDEDNALDAPASYNATEGRWEFEWAYVGPWREPATRTDQTEGFLGAKATAAGEPHDLIFTLWRDSALDAEAEEAVRGTLGDSQRTAVNNEILSEKASGLVKLSNVVVGTANPSLVDDNVTANTKRIHEGQTAYIRPRILRQGGDLIPVPLTAAVKVKDAAGGTIKTVTGTTSASDGRMSSFPLALSTPGRYDVEFGPLYENTYALAGNILVSSDPLSIVAAAPVVHPERTNVAYLVNHDSTPFDAKVGTPWDRGTGMLGQDYAVAGKPARAPDINSLGRLAARLPEVTAAGSDAAAETDTAMRMILRAIGGKWKHPLVTNEGILGTMDSRLFEAIAGRLYAATTGRVQLSVAGNFRSTHENPAGSGKVIYMYSTPMSGDISAIAVLAHRHNPTAGLPSNTPVYCKNARWVSGNNNNSSVLVVRHDIDTTTALSGGGDGAGYGFLANGNTTYPSVFVLEPGVTLGTNVGFAGAAAIAVNWYWVEVPI